MNMHAGTAVLDEDNDGWHSVMSTQRLSAVRGSARVVAFGVRVDAVSDPFGTVTIGACDSLPAPSQTVGDTYLGCSYDSDGCLFNNGAKISDEAESYGTGDEIELQIDFVAHTATFFKNGVNQGRALLGEHLIMLRACVSFCGAGTQTTLLSL